MSICKDCDGTGRLGLQREGCSSCLGSGYIKEKILLNKKCVEIGLENLIERQLRITDMIDGNNAYTKDECKKRLALIEERDLINHTLNNLFNIQSFQYAKSDYGGIEIS